MFILHSSPLIYARHGGGQAGEPLPFRALCSLAPAWDCGTAYRQNYPLRLMGEPRVGQRLKAIFDCTPSIRATALDALIAENTIGKRDYRPICAQFEYRLMSRRRLVITLRAPSPAVRLGRSFISGVLGSKSRCVGQARASRSLEALALGNPPCSAAD